MVKASRLSHQEYEDHQKSSILLMNGIHTTIKLTNGMAGQKRYFLLRYTLEIDFVS